MLALNAKPPTVNAWGGGQYAQSRLRDWLQAETFYYPKIWRPNYNRVWGLECRVEGSGFTVKGLGEFVNPTLSELYSDPSHSEIVRGFSSPQIPTITIT